MGHRPFKRADGIPRRIDGKNNPEYQKVLRSRRMYWLNKIKLSWGCQSCGYRGNPVALDFDHLDPSEKRFTVSARNITRKLKELFAEIRRCRVLCANCHRIHSYEEGHFSNT